MNNNKAQKDKLVEIVFCGIPDRLTLRLAESAYKEAIKQLKEGSDDSIMELDNVNGDKFFIRTSQIAALGTKDWRPVEYASLRFGE